MATVPNYTKGIVRRREVANQVDPSAIGAAGAVARGVGDLANTGAQIATVIKQKRDTSAVNSAVIERQKNDLQFREELKKENADNPFDYAERVAPLYKERDKAIMESLPSDEARQAYQSTAERLNLQNYEDDLRWQNTRSVEIFANKAEQSIDNLELMAYRGEPLDEIKRNRQATRVTLEGVLSPEQLAKFDQKSNESIHTSFIQGKIDANPYEARKILDSQKYDDDLGLDNILTLTARTDAKIKAIEDKQIKDLAENRKLFKTDPVKLAMKEGIDPDDHEGLYSAQLKAGVPNSNISIMSKDKASDITFMLNGAKSADDVIRVLYDVQKEYEGFEEIALNDLKRNDMSDNTAMIAMMDFDADRNIIEAAFQMGKDGATIKETALKRGNIKATDITTAVADKASDVLEVMAFETDMIQTAKIQKGMQDIATFFVAQGDDTETAVAKATNWALNKTAIAQIDNLGFWNSEHKVRVPNAFAGAPDQIEEMLEYVLETTKFADDPKDDADIKRNGRFVLHPSEDKYYIRNAINSPVLNDKGEPMTFDIIDTLREIEQRNKEIKGGFSTKDREYLESIKKNGALMEAIKESAGQ
jgi:hypothetical protein